MARIRSFNLDRWSEPDEQRRVRHIGMADARETFEKLKKHLEATGLLPDEYFLFDGEYETQLKGELPNFDHALCVPNYGASEGIYLDISLVCRNEDGSRKFIPFATGKTLEESGDAFLRMHRIAGECSLLLNGRGIYFERSETPLFLTSEETDAVINALELEILSDISPEQARLLEGVMGKIDGQRLTPVCAVACHGVDDYSLWTADLPVAVVQEPAPVEDAVYESMQTQALREGVNQLPEVQKRRLQMYFFDGLTYEEIAVREGCSYQAVQKSIAAALKKIRKFLK